VSVRERRLESARARAEAKQVAAAVSWAENAIELTDDEVAGALGGVSTRTVARYREVQQRPQPSTVIAAEILLVLAKALDAVFGNDQDRMQAWLHEPLPAFRGRTPLRMIVQGDAAKVVTLLANIDASVFD
jgi:uncharacterized protein (DUF2384 family)